MTLSSTRPSASPAQTSLILENVSLEFPVYNTHARSLKRSLLHLTTGGRIGLSGHDLVVVKSLADISIVLEHGDRVALLGHNGAGKTTLLRVLAGAYEPTAGVVRRTGRVAALFDLMLGMDPEATGEENITIRAMLMGLSRRQIAQRQYAIAAFTELGDYLQMPIRTYSSGMLLRLGFGISTSIEPEILLMDEWLAAGDAAFMVKAQARLEDLIGNTGILVLASHSLGMIKRICNKAVWMEKGAVMRIGEVGEVSEAYLQSVSGGSGGSADETHAA
jgi:lipopolysaccharide transport system ATP-binding protein